MDAHDFQSGAEPATPGGAARTGGSLTTGARKDPFAGKFRSSSLGIRQPASRQRAAAGSWKRDPPNSPHGGKRGYGQLSVQDSCQPAKSSHNSGFGFGERSIAKRSSEKGQASFIASGAKKARNFFWGLFGGILGNGRKNLRAGTLSRLL
jgi:hypothetical protein